MPEDECSMQELASQLGTANFRGYLLSRGWVETPSRLVDQLRFEARMSGSADVYEMYLPASIKTAKYRTRLLRNIYKLCGIEDREPAEIAREIIAIRIEVEPS